MTDGPRQDDDPDDPRRGALIGLGVIVLLVIVGWLLIHVLRNTARVQDCVMSGRINCAPIEAADPPARN